MKISLQVKQDRDNGDPRDQRVNLESGHDGEVLVHISGSDREVSVSLKELKAAIVALDLAVLSRMMPAQAEDGPNHQLEVYQHVTAEDYRNEGDGIWLRRGFLGDILQRTGKALSTLGSVKLLSLPEAAQKLRDELDQAHATVKEMGELIDQQTAEIERLKDIQNRIGEAVNEIRGSV